VIDAITSTGVSCQVRLLRLNDRDLFEVHFRLDIRQMVGGGQYLLSQFASLLGTSVSAINCMKDSI